MRRSFLISTLTALTLAGTWSPTSAADVDAINFPPPISPIPSAADSPAASYNPVQTAPVRLVPERRIADPRGRAVLVETGAPVDHRPLELLRPPMSRMTSAVAPATSVLSASAAPEAPVGSSMVDEARARRMIVAAGYFGIQELYQDETGTWHALGMPVGAGAAATITIDRSGALASRPTLAALGHTQTASR